MALPGWPSARVRQRKAATASNTTATIGSHQTGTSSSPRGTTRTAESPRLLLYTIIAGNCKPAFSRRCGDPLVFARSSATVATWPFSAPTNPSSGDTTRPCSGPALRLRLRPVVYQKQQPVGGQRHYGRRSPAVPRGDGHSGHRQSARARLLSDQPGQPRSPVVAEIGRCFCRGIATGRNPGNSLCCHASRRFTTATEESGLRNIVRALDEVADRTRGSECPLSAGNHSRPGHRSAGGSSSWPRFSTV